MSKLNSFEDALKKVLLPEKKKTKPLPKAKKKVRSKYVSEAMAGSNSMPGTLTPSRDSGWSNGLPPFSKYSTDMDSAGGSVDMRDIGKEESALAKSEQRKPYPLETVLDFIAQSGEELKNAEELIEISIKKNNISLTDAQKKALKKVNQTIKSSLGNINKAAGIIDSIKLS